jgi:hypothetical protein
LVFEPREDGSAVASKVVVVIEAFERIALVFVASVSCVWLHGCHKYCVARRLPRARPAAQKARETARASAGWAAQGLSWRPRVFAR